MCGRAALTSQTLEEIADALDAEPVAPALYRPRYNIAPTDQVWVLTLDQGRRVLAPATWGLPAPARRPVINVRSEALGRGAFASLFRETRALFVCSGFYEWNADRQPYLFTPSSTSGGFLLLGALLAPRGPAELPATAVLTTRPNDAVAQVHDRMPVVIPPADISRWLASPSDEVASLLAPVAATTLQA
ncbi:MAG TPA: SOS response-associated peptidase, partial [Polyangia bacterium]